MLDGNDHIFECLDASWDAASCNPLAYVLGTPIVYSPAWDQLWFIRVQTGWSPEASALLSGVTFSYHYLQSLLAPFASVPSQDSSERKTMCLQAGRSMRFVGWLEAWLGGVLLTWFLYSPHYLSVNLWPRYNALLRSLCLSLIFPPNCSSCFLFLSSFILV